MKPIKLPPQALARIEELERENRRLRGLLHNAAHAAADLIESTTPWWRRLLALIKNRRK